MFLGFERPLSKKPFEVKKQIDADQTLQPQVQDIKVENYAFPFGLQVSIEETSLSEEDDEDRSVQKKPSTGNFSEISSSCMAFCEAALLFLKDCFERLQKSTSAEESKEIISESNRVYEDVQHVEKKALAVFNRMIYSDPLFIFRDPDSDSKRACDAKKKLQAIKALIKQQQPYPIDLSNQTTSFFKSTFMPL